MGELVAIHSKNKEASAIQYFGHSTVLIQTDKGKRIIVDPWLEGNPSCPEDLHNVPSIDYIVLTHGHFDHTASAVPLAKGHKSQIIATYELVTLLGKEGIPEGQLHGMNKGGTMTLPESEGITVTLTNAFHSSSYQSSDGAVHYAGEACGVVITLESGMRIYHAGDTCLFSDMRLIGERYKPTVALLPIGDRFTMSPQDAAAATALIKPQFVIPIHHSTFPLLTGTPEEFQKQLARSESQVVVLKPGELFELSHRR